MKCYCLFNRRGVLAKRCKNCEKINDDLRWSLDHSVLADFLIDLQDRLERLERKLE